MARKPFDILTSVGGIAVVVVLIVAGGLLTWGHSFVNSNVRDQLAQQQIYFPPQAAFGHAKPGTEITPSMIPSVWKYAAQQLLTGAQAEAYANHFIAVHLSEMPYGGVYSKISAASLASPSNAKLAALKQTFVHGYHPARPAARGIRLLEDRHRDAGRRDRLVHPGRSHVGPGWPWLLARPPHRERDGDVQARRAGDSYGVTA